MQDPLDIKKINNILLGFLIRKQLGKQYIFRVRKGNGYGGSIKNKIYQDKMIYFVPPSINNPEGERARQLLAQAVWEWKNILSEEEKKIYHEKARKRNISGYHLYISEKIKNNY